tara:strand:+ start:14735 stop:15754 length:1020 start_codon:yes stop_codon:yes gene_type:complete
MSKKNSNALVSKNFLTNKKIFNIYSTFKKNLEKNIKRKPFLVAVSGGPDSLALTALSKIYKKEKRTSVYFVLVDHGIRKKSDKEAILVKKILKKQKIFLNIIKIKTKIKKNIQAQARNERYKLLTQFCKKRSIKYILTGHHSDDQIETFLIRLSRGSGVQGLSSMSAITKIDKKISLFRPLLNFKKKDLVYIAKKNFGRTIKDPTNKDKKYLRTKIRHLKSQLEKSGIKHEQIIRSINNIASTKDTLNNYLEKVKQTCVKTKKKQTLINLKNLFLEPDEIKLKVLGNEIKTFSKSYYPPRSKKVMNLINEIEFKTRNKFTLGGCLLKKVGNLLIITKEA